MLEEATLTRRDDSGDDERRRSHAAQIEADHTMLEFLRQEGFAGRYYSEWEYRLVATTRAASFRT